MVSASLAGSAGRYAGGQTSLGYQYVRPEFSLDLLSTRALGDYGDLGSREDAPVVRQTDRATVSFPITRSQSMALSYIGYRQPDAPAAKLGSATYTVNLHSRVAMNLSAFHDFNQSDSNGVCEPDADDGRSDPGLRVGQPPAAPGQLQRGRAAFGGL